MDHSKLYCTVNVLWTVNTNDVFLSLLSKRSKSTQSPKWLIVMYAYIVDEITWPVSTCTMILYSTLQNVHTISLYENTFRGLSVLGHAVLDKLQRIMPTKMEICLHCHACMFLYGHCTSLEGRGSPPCNIHVCIHYNRGTTIYTICVCMCAFVHK